MTPLYDITQGMYGLMNIAAKPNEHEELVFTGSLTNVYKAAGGSARYYSLVRELLLSPALNPCIEIRRRGNDKQNSIVILNHPPPPEWAEITPSDLTRPREGDTLRGLEDRLAALEQWRESTFREVNLLETLRDFESRLNLLENGS